MHDVLGLLTTGPTVVISIYQLFFMNLMELLS